MTVHDELEALAGRQPAGYIGIEFFARPALDRLEKTIQILKGQSIPAGTGQLHVVLRDVLLPSAPKGEFAPLPNPLHGFSKLDLLISPDFEIVLGITIPGNPAQQLSELRVAIKDLRMHIHGQDNAIVLEGVDFQATRTITRVPNADDLLAGAGIDPLEAARVEGHLSYGVASQAITKTLGQRVDVPLAPLFPAVDFGRNIKIEALAGGQALGIIPTDLVTIEASATCGCAPGPDLGMDPSKVEKLEPANPGTGSEIGKVAVGGPIPDNKDPLLDFGPRSQGEGTIAGLYLPSAFAEDLVVDVMPAIKVRVRDDGVIGFEAQASVGFKNIRLSLDSAGGGLLVDVDLDISATAEVTFELFKGLRVPIGWGIVEPTPGSQASLQVGYYPSLDASGIRLRSTLTKADMGSYVAVIAGVGSLLSLIGIGALVGVLVDVLLSILVSSKIPEVLRKEVAKTMGSNEWRLIDFGPLLPNAHPTYPRELHSVKPGSSILTSVDFNAG